LAFIKSIRNALEKFDIETHAPFERKAKSPHSENISSTWELRIRRKGQIKKFLKEIGFAHPVKLKRMRSLISILEDR
jgi:intein-encoded DNA endonuclease-like protein